MLLSLVHEQIDWGLDKRRVTHICKIKNIMMMNEKYEYGHLKQ